MVCFWNTLKRIKAGKIHEFRPIYRFHPVNTQLEALGLHSLKSCPHVGLYLGLQAFNVALDSCWPLAPRLYLHDFGFWIASVCCIQATETINYMTLVHCSLGCNRCVM